MVEVKLFANLREAAGRESISLEFERPPTVEELLKRLLVELPSLSRILMKDGRYDDRYKILIGPDIVFPEDFSKKTSTSFAILPPVSGG